jgi:hypothetical protein
MESLMQVLEVCLLGLVKDKKELDCWRLHLDIVDLLNHESFNEEELKRLTAMTLQWKQSMVDLYGDVRMINGKKEKRKTVNGKRKRKRSAKDDDKEEEEVIPATPTSPVGKKLSFSFPNFETCEHWEQQIAFLGPPWFQDTKLWEQRHQDARRTTRRTNQCNITADVLIKVPLPSILSISC